MKPQTCRQSFLHSAGIVSAAIALSRVTGLLRESVLGWMFGAGATFDAYVLGFRIPALARELFAEGALSSAFIPAFTRVLTTKGQKEARELASAIATIVVVAVGVSCALGIFFAPVVVNLFAPGFHAVPGKFDLAVSLVRTMFPFLLLIALASQAQGVLYSIHRFGISAASSSIFNLISVASGLMLGWWWGPRFGITPVRGMAIGVVIGGAAQLGFQLPSLWRAGFGWRFRWDPRNEGVRQILTLMGPALIGSASGQLNVLVNTNFAAGLRDAAGHVMNGPVSWLAYAYRFFSLPMGVFGVAIASAALPRLSQSAAVRDIAGFRKTLSRSVVMILLLTIPSAVGLAMLGESMIAIVFQHGKFTAFDTHQTALALACYSAGLAGYAITKLVSPAFYAFNDARTPMFVSIASVAVNGVTAFFMVHWTSLGHAGLALSSSVVSSVSAILLTGLIRQRIGGIDGRRVAISFAKIGGASAAMWGICHFALTSIHASWLRVALGVPLGVAVFWTVSAMLGLEELAEVREAIGRPLLKFQRDAS